MNALQPRSTPNHDDAPDLRLTTDAKPVEKPMVLHVRVVAGSGGGPDKTIVRSPKHIEGKNVRMAAAYIHPRGDAGIDKLRETARQHHCPFYAIPERGPLDPVTVAALYQLCRKLRVTVWHGHDYKSNLIGVILRRFWPMSLVTTVHGWTNETWRTRLYRRVDHWAIRRYDQVIAVGRKLEAQCRELGVGDDRLTYIRNAIDLDEYQHEMSRDDRRDDLGIARDRFVIAVLGRLSTEKGAGRAIRLVSKLREDYPQVELHLIGDGPQRQALESLVENRALRSRVRFWGWQDRPQRVLEAADMLLLPSHTEGFPNAVLEAMALRLPVAATNVGDVRRILDKEHCGVILPDDEADWPKRVAPLIVSEDRRNLLAERAYERVRSLYSFRTRMKLMRRVYDRVLSIPESIRQSTRRRQAA